MRFRLLTLLLVVTAAGIAAPLLARPSLRFGEPEYSVRVVEDGKRLLNVAIPVKNRGIYPIWYYCLESRKDSALGFLRRKGNTVSNRSMAKLRSGGSVNMREFYLKPDDKLGIVVVDLMGRSHKYHLEDLNIRENWERRLELPVDKSTL